MNDSASFWVIVPAAGTGTRFSASSLSDNATPPGGSLSPPKQYTVLEGQSIAERTLSLLLQLDRLAQIVVVIAEHDQWYSQLALSGHAQLCSAQGGCSRAESVFNGLQSLQGKAQPDDWVLVHDIARPLLQLDDVERLIQVCAEHNSGGILVSPIHATVKASVESIESDTKLLKVKQTLSREHLWLAQTPQMFRYKDLCEALAAALNSGKSNQLVDITDEASAMELAGHDVLLVPGSTSNIKITTEEDIALARYYLQQVNSKESI